MERRWTSCLRTALCVALTALAVWQALHAAPSPPRVPGLEERERTLLRIWLTGAPGGAQAWLTQQLAAFGKQHPGVQTRLRIAAPQDLTAPGTVLPDVILFMSGDLADAEDCLVPIGGEWPVAEPLLAAGRMEGSQYALPLCWGAWVLAIDSALDPVPAATPTPPTLLGRPAATSAPTDAPGYPLQSASAADVPLQSPGGAALMTLAGMLPPGERPPLPADFAQPAPAAVYDAFRQHHAATAMLTTGQIAAFSSLVSAGKGFPFRTIAPETIVTDQVLMAALTADAPEEAEELLRFLTGQSAQQALTAQSLHTVRDDMTLYAAGLPREVEESARRSLTAVNAFLPASRLHEIAWQAFQGTLTMPEALSALGQGA